jgi:hypothetical protein
MNLAVNTICSHSECVFKTIVSNRDILQYDDDEDKTQRTFNNQRRQYLKPFGKQMRSDSSLDIDVGLQGWRDLEDLDIDGMIILRWIPKK